MPLSVQKTMGVCMMTLARSHHLGRIGTYGEQAANAGMVSIHFVNINDHVPSVAPLWFSCTFWDKSSLHCHA